MRSVSSETGSSPAEAGPSGPGPRRESSFDFRGHGRSRCNAIETDGAGRGPDVPLGGREGNRKFDLEVDHRRGGEKLVRRSAIEVMCRDLDLRSHDMLEDRSERKGLSCPPPYARRSCARFILARTPCQLRPYCASSSPTVNFKVMVYE